MKARRFSPLELLAMGKAPRGRRAQRAREIMHDVAPTALLHVWDLAGRMLSSCATVTRDPARGLAYQKLMRNNEHRQPQCNFTRRPVLHRLEDGTGETDAGVTERWLT